MNDTASGGAPCRGDLLDGRFELREAIGRGASGQVFAALDRQTGEEVALKVFEAGDERQPHEVRALARLDHPHVVALRGHGTLADGRAYLALERLTGHTLDQWLRRTSLTAPQLGPLLAQIASALDAAHAAGLVHGDVRAANVFLESLDGRVKLLDFGVVQVHVGRSQGADDDRRALGRLALDALGGGSRGPGGGASGEGPLTPPLVRVLELAIAGGYASAGALAEAYHGAAGLPWPPALQDVPGTPRERESFSAGRGSGLPAEPPSWMPDEPLRLSSVPPPPPAATAVASGRVVLWGALALAVGGAVLWWLL